MAETATLLIYGAIASAASTAVGAVSAIQSGINSNRIAKQNAIAAKRRAEAEAEQHRLDTIRRIGQTRAAYGASGVELTGSVDEALGDDALTAGRQSSLILYDGKMEAARFRAKGRQSLGEGIGRGIGGFGESAGTLLTGAYRYQKEIE